MDKAYNIFMYVLVLALLLAPIEILFLVEPNKWVSAGIVPLFALAGVATMSRMPAIKPEQMFVVMCAYMAVVGTFLANLQGSQRGFLAGGA